MKTEQSSQAPTLELSESAEHWLQMWKRVTDPEERFKAKLKTDREQRKIDKITDTGL